MQVAGFFHISAGALVPEQLVHYVRSVSGRIPLLCGEYIAYLHEGHAVLVAYPGMEATLREKSGPLCRDRSACGTDWETPTGGAAPSLASALAILRERCSEITVIAPFRPSEAPADAISNRDCYWQIGLPPSEPGSKLRNILRRAERDVAVQEDAWSPEHESLVGHYLNTRSLRPGTRAIYASLSSYAALGGDATHVAKVCLLSARMADGSLAGFTLGDLSGLSTAFYMFAFRDEKSPPGTADLLLSNLMRRAAELGHERMNLGLGINSGISFFKKKWHASPLAAYIETSWSFNGSSSRGGLLSSLLRRFSGG